MLQGPSGHRALADTEKNTAEKICMQGREGEVASSRSPTQPRHTYNFKKNKYNLETRKRQQTRKVRPNNTDNIYMRTHMHKHNNNNMCMCTCAWTCRVRRHPSPLRHRAKSVDTPQALSEKLRM